MAITLTPAQSQALDDFEVAAQAAADAKAAASTAAAELAAAQVAADHTAVDALSKHGDALAKAQVFVDAMIPPADRAAALAAKKKV